MKLGKSRYNISILEYEESYRLTLSLLSLGTLFILMSEQHTYLNIEVEDSEWCPSAIHDIVHNLMKSSIIECLKYSAQVHSAHSIIGAVVHIAPDYILYGNAMRKDDINIG